jgi:small subunit ribosomal protein S16
VAVRIRLRRTGKRRQPQYRLVVAEGSSPRGGRFLEVIGHYNPRVEPPSVSVNEERALWWLRQGAQPSETAKGMLVRTGVWDKFGQASRSSRQRGQATKEEGGLSADQAGAAAAEEDSQ